MRLLLVLMTMIVSTLSYADVYNEKGEYVGKEYNTTESATANAGITAVGLLLSKKTKERKAIQKSYQAVMNDDSKANKFDTCDDACKAEIQAEVLKKYRVKN